MAILTDKTKLTLGVEVVLNTTSNPRTIQLVATGDLTTDGVTLDTVYEALKLFWRNDSTLPKFQFPMNPITNEQFDLVADAANVGWDWKDDTTRYLIKTGGWAIKDNAGVSKEEWAGIISLGSIAGADQPYFIQVAGGTVVNFQNTGPINQAVKVYGDLTHDNFDYRSYFQMFIRTQGKIYASAALTDIGQTVMTYKVYAFPLAESTDPTILDSDVTVGAFGSYNGKYEGSWFGGIFQAALSLFVYHTGTWIKPIEIWAGRGGVWVKTISVWVINGGTWKQGN